MRKVIAVVVILILIGYSAYLVAVPHYNYYGFKSDVEEFLKIKLHPNFNTDKKDVMAIARQYDIPITDKDLSLTWDRRYRLKVSWSVTVDFFTLYQKTFNFSINSSPLYEK